MARSASVKDVAAAAGVSLGTVSNVLNRPDRVSPDTRERVLRAMADLGFVRNESARQLRAGSSRTLAYVMLDASNPFFTDVAQGIDTAAEAVDLSLVLCNSRNSGAREQAHLALLEQQRVQGILVTPVDPDSASLDEVARRGTPVVVVDRTRADQSFCSVAVDDVLGGRLAVEHLADRGPHPGRLHRWSARARPGRGPAGAGPRRHGPISGRPVDDLVAGDHGGALGRRGARGRPAARRDARAAPARPPRSAPTTWSRSACSSRRSASGIQVPEELAIVGYDDIEFAAAAAVPLTSVRQPRQLLGRTAAELVLDEATNAEHTHRQVLFTPELVARASTLG